MFSWIFRLIFWGLIIAVGTQVDFGIFSMRDKMREMALEQVSKPWPELWAAPQVDFSKYDVQYRKPKKDKPKLDDSISDALGTYKKIKRHFK